ncbi:MAG: hypothetical protein HYW02_02445 [Deltaproteobacteria bacterium]|nr:hypothetical protein [Deltaproteobacteria bacterium]
MVSLIESNERCHTEEVKSFNRSDPILSGECHRVICGPNFWGKSALDLCCEEEPVVEGEITYKRCQMRHPKEENAREAWNEVQIQTDGPTGGCGNWRYMFDEEGDGTYGQLDLPDPIEFLIPSAFAVTDNSLTADQWDEARRSDFTVYFQELANRINEALETEDPNEVGEPGSEFRMYVEDTLDTALFLAFILDPTETTPCPGTWESLCTILSPPTVNPGNHFFPTWSLPACIPGASSCTLAGTFALNSIRFIPDLRITDRETLARGLVMELGAHEMGHVLYDWINELYKAPLLLSPIPVREIKYSRNPVINYENEAEAIQIGAITEHFLTAPQRSDASLFGADNPASASLIRRSQRVFQLLRNGETSLARVSTMSDRVYLSSFFYSALSEFQREEFDSACPSCSSGPGRDAAACESCFMERILQELDRLGITLQTLEDDLYIMGGPFGLNGVPSSYAGESQELRRRVATVHPLLVHDTAASPDTGGPVGTAGDAAEAPPEDYNWDNPENIGGETNSDAWSGDEDRLNECITDFYFNQIHAGTAGEMAIPAECYQYCWNRDFELCEPLRVNDLYNNCSPSNLDRNCEAALREQRLADCATNCQNSGGQGYCATYCSDTPSMSICNTRCRADRDQGYCDRSCLTYFTESYCVPYCEADHRRQFCDSLCAADRNHGFCDTLCEEQSGPWCDENCADRHARGLSLPGYCDDICERGWERSWCDGEEEEGTPGDSGGGESGSGGDDTIFEGIRCGVSWTRRDNYTIWEHFAGTSCYPYVGPVRCCASPPSEWIDFLNTFGELCFRDGPDLRCNERDVCGCGIVSSLPSSAGCCTRANDGFRAVHSCYSDPSLAGVVNIQGCVCVGESYCSE